MSNLWFTEFHNDQVGHTVRVKEVVHRSQSEFQTIEIFETPCYGKLLILDGMVMTSEKDEFIYHEMLTHVPLLAHPNPKRVLVIGGGDGGTVREVLRYPSIEQVVLCEIDGQVVDACKTHLPGIAGKLEDPRVQIFLEDAVAYIDGYEGPKFDVILIDSTDPIGAGEGLFTTGFYQDVFAALETKGIMANQTESPWASPKLFQSIYQKLQPIFPVVNPYLAHIPSYPGGIWSWTFCSKGLQPAIRQAELAAEIEGVARYFNRDIHQSAFMLPNYAKKLLTED